MKNISIKAILLGLVALLVLDTVFAMLLTLGLTGEISGEAAKNIQLDPLFLKFRMLVGAAALVGAGFITEKIAKKTNLLNSGILGVISVILTILVLNDSYPSWYLISSYLYQLPAALLGGYLVNRSAVQKITD